MWIWIKNTAFFLENLWICNFQTETPMKFADLRFADQSLQICDLRTGNTNLRICDTGLRPRFSADLQFAD
jgi:hypothetical protein